MAVLEILRFPDPRLRLKAQTVSSFDARLERLAQDMLDTMYCEGGIGLAAVQINRSEHLVVVDVSETRDAPQVFVNLALQPLGEEYCINEEGCLSMPDIRAEVRRRARVRVQAQDLRGRAFEMEAGGLLAVCLQHELDHLKGKLFLDYLSPLKRERVRRKLQKAQKERCRVAA